MSALAKEQPSIYFATVSPGGTKTNLFQNTPQPMHCMIQCSSPPLVLLPLLLLMSPRSARHCGFLFTCIRAMHSVEKAAARYVAAVYEPDFPAKFPSGSVVGSPSSCCPFWLGLAGPLTNQARACDA